MNEMNGFLILSLTYGICALFELGVSAASFFCKKPNMGLGIGSLICAFMSGLFGIWVATFNFAVLDVGISFIITMIVLMMAMLIQQARKE